MNLFSKKLLTVGLLAACGTSLFSPVLPRGNAYTFASLDGGRGCAVTQDVGQTPYSWIRKSIVDSDDQRNVDQRVVRIYKNDRTGTGYVLDDGFVLTANHVTSPMENFVISNGQTLYTGNVVASSSEPDIALIKTELAGNFGPTKIGDDPKPNETVTIVTLDTADIHYENGSKSRTDLSSVRYNGKLSEESQKSIRELEKKEDFLQLQLADLNKEIKISYKPYISDSERIDLLPPYSESSFYFFDIFMAPETKDILNYTPKTSTDQTLTGTSGSAMINDRNELVGVHFAATQDNGTRISSNLRSFAHVPDDLRDQVHDLFAQGSDVSRQVKELHERGIGIYNQLGEIDSAIRMLEKPSYSSAVSPQAIKKFLEDYCDSS